MKSARSGGSRLEELSGVELNAADLHSVLLTRLGARDHPNQLLRVEGILQPRLGIIVE